MRYDQNLNDFKPMKFIYYNYYFQSIYLYFHYFKHLLTLGFLKFINQKIFVYFIFNQDIQDLE